MAFRTAPRYALVPSHQRQVKSCNHWQKWYETRDRVFQARHVKGADGDSNESDQGRDLQVRRERKADREQCDARLSYRAAKG